MNSILTSRNNNFLEKIIIIDGISGTGKGVIDDFLSTFDKIEILSVSGELENLTILRDYNKIDKDGYETFIKIHLDYLLYETMMGRNVNTRLFDQSGIFKSQKIIRYLLRLFIKGDKEMPEIIEKTKPVLRLMTHSIMGISEPLFRALNTKLYFIDVVRNPLAILKANYKLNKGYESINGIKRQFKIYCITDGKEIPYWAMSFKEEYLNMNVMEKTIYELKYKSEKSNKFKINHKDLYDKYCLTVPFENFVEEPIEYMKKIANLIKEKNSSNYKKLIKKYKIPRKNDVNSTFKDEIIDFARKKGANENAIKSLIELSYRYESFLSNINYD